MKMRRRKITEEDLDPTPETAAAGDAGGSPAAAPAGPDSQASAIAQAAADATDDPEGYLALAQRTQADFDNFRKRSRAEVETAAERGVANLARELAPALDNLDHALRAIAEQTGESPRDEVARGLNLIRDEFLAAFARCGIELDHPEGVQFDPNCHEAVAQVPASGVEPGAVVEVHQTGYRVGSTLIRPARVSVAQMGDG